MIITILILIAVLAFIIYRTYKSWGNFESTLGTIWILMALPVIPFAGSILLGLFATKSKDFGPVYISPLNHAVIIAISAILLIINISYLVVKRKELSNLRLSFALLRIVFYIFIPFLYQ